MKKFSKNYPCLAYWAEVWGSLEINSNSYNKPFLMLLDEGGLVYEDDESASIDEALELAEKYLQEEAESLLEDEEVIAELEALYKKYKLDA